MMLLGERLPMNLSSRKPDWSFEVLREGNAGVFLV